MTAVFARNSTYHWPWLDVIERFGAINDTPRKPTAERYGGDPRHLSTNLLRQTSLNQSYITKST